MYDPVGDGIAKAAHAVRHTQTRPHERLSGLVHCFWELWTERPLAEDFLLHAMPDACINILFNQTDPEIAGITALRTRHEVLNLGTAFHYVGIQLLPGVWRGDRSEISDRFVGRPYRGVLPLVSTGKRMCPLPFSGKQEILTELTHDFIGRGLVVRNPIVEKILLNLDAIRTVSDMSAVTHLSARHMQRRLKDTTGLSPHDLLKIFRIQQSFRRHYLDLYADQSHYIHSFRRITGHTPGSYAERFDVRSAQYGEPDDA